MDIPQPFLIHVDSHKRIALRYDGATLVGRGVELYDYRGSRWSAEMQAELTKQDYVQLPEDPTMSRTHVQFEHIAGGDVCASLKLVDLNSANGVYVNGQQLKPGEGTVRNCEGNSEGMPIMLLNHLDSILLGNAYFVLDLEMEVQNYVSSTRQALLIRDSRIPNTDFDSVRKVLGQKEFLDSRISEFDIANEERPFYELTEEFAQTADPQGISVVYFKLDAQGDTFLSNKQRYLQVADLVKFCDQVAGLKIVLLQCNNDIPRFKEEFEARGYADTIFATCSTFSDAALEHPSFETGPATGEDKSRAVDDIGPRDGLDDLLYSLIHPQSNQLINVRSFINLIRQNPHRFDVIIGKQFRDEDEYGGIHNTVSALGDTTGRTTTI